MKQTLTFNAIIKDKKIFFENRPYFDWMIAKTFKEGEKLSLNIENKRSQRSLAQNSYLWGVVYKVVAEATGHTTEEVDEIMKQMLMPKKFKVIKGIEFEIPKSIKELNKMEMTEYIEKVRNFSATELNAYVPTPEDAGFGTPKEETKLDYPTLEEEPEF